MKITDEMVSAARLAYETGFNTNGTKRNEAMRRALTAALASLSHTMGVKVKELEWFHVLNQGWRPSAYEALITGDISGDIGPFTYHSPDKFHAQSFLTLEAAKAAAQQDYEQRIRSALTPMQQPVVEAPERIRVAQDGDGFFTCREAISGSQEYVRADLVDGPYASPQQSHATLLSMVTEAALASPQAVPGWEKIETAPKKGMPRILLALPDGRVCEGYWGAAKYNRKNKEYDRAWVSSPYSGDVHPTHWMPLPKAPALNAEVKP